MQSAMHLASRFDFPRQDPDQQESSHRLSMDAARVQAWTAFWREAGGESRCLANAPPDVLDALNGHWSQLATRLVAESRILDIGCGAGAVTRVLLNAQADLKVVGVDSAMVPAPADRRFALLPGIRMEALPFEAARFDAAVSQFGFEYGNCRQAAKELARVLVPGARFSFLVHHSHSSVVRESRVRNEALRALLGENVANAFRSGDAADLDRQVMPIGGGAPTDAVVRDAIELLRARIGCAPAQRTTIWGAVAEAFAPEQAILSALEAACVAPSDLNEWLAGFSGRLEIGSVREMRRSTGEIIAWKIEGALESRVGRQAA